LEEKLKLARETFRLAGVEDVIELVAGDAREHISDLDYISFCFLDAEKEVYQDCYNLVIDKMKSCGLFAADNVISHRDILQPFLDFVESDNRVDSVIVPIGKGLLLCRRI
ncbi:MAG: O-methyltransferase, partial [Candidatus Zixiibacteriota bacterium]